MRGMPAARAHRLQLQEKRLVPRLHDAARSGGGAAAERSTALRGAPATLSLPRGLRLAVVKQPRVLKVVERALVRAVWRWQRAVAKRLGVTSRLQGGAVSFTQWFSSALALTPHLHVLLPEVLWTASGEVAEGSVASTRPSAPAAARNRGVPSSSMIRARTRTPDRGGRAPCPSFRSAARSWLGKSASSQERRGCSSGPPRTS